MKIGIAQLNFIVGDIDGNTKKILKAYEKLQKQRVGLVATSELAILGYPPKDLLERPDIIKKQLDALKNKIAPPVKNIPLIVGFAEPNQQEGKPLFNSAAWIQNGRIRQIYRKTLLPTYDVFDENRYFEPWRDPQEPMEFFGKKVTVLICEDIWAETANQAERRQYKINPVKMAFNQNTSLAIAINSSPYWWGKGEARLNLAKIISQKYNFDFVYINQVGGNDDLIFDGRSFACNQSGQLIGALPSFEEKLAVIDINSSDEITYVSDKQNLRELHRALVLGIKDYVQKCGGFDGAVIGISGGIDSAITAVLAVDALGKDKVLGVAMPSRFSSKSSVTDAKKLAGNLGIKLEQIPIQTIFSQYLKSLKTMFEGLRQDATEENIQARIRGTILMALSNKFGKILLSTGNKSELACGYATLYGDMAGGLAVISDVYKTDIYRLAKWINRNQDIIPQNIIEKAPSAELSPNQKDTDFLPPYEILDPILRMYIDEGKSSDSIMKAGLRPAEAAPAAQAGYNKKVVKRIIQLVNRNEFKRRQAAPGLKVSSKSFGPGRRMPIVAKF